MRYLFVLAGALLMIHTTRAQSAEALVQKVKSKFEKIHNYEADATLKTNVTFIKAPISNVKIFYNKPDQLKIINKNGISFIPKGSVNINFGSILTNNGDYDVIDAGKDSDGLHIVKLLPKSDTADIVLSTLYIDEKNLLIKKSKTTTKENGTYELGMTYGKYSEYGLPDKIVFSFNTKDYKLPKGVTFDYDEGSKKNEEPSKNKKGTVEITYTNYIINRR
jgi:outer membrane lipoprotein-sorting protein